VQVNKRASAKILYFLVSLPFFFAGLNSYRPMHGYYCERVVDGDTVELRRFGKGELLKVRLSFIDAPESLQQSLDGKKIGEQSTRFLKKLIEGQELKVRFLGVDMYARKLAVLYLKEVNVNKLMVQKGWALAYPLARPLGVLEEYLIAQSQARMQRVGIWQSEGFLSPWQYRKNSKGSSNENLRRDKKISDKRKRIHQSHSRKFNGD
jgi:micrococcal nuclease